MKVIKVLIERSQEIGLCEIEDIVHGQNGFILRIDRTDKYWHVVYKV